MSTWRLASRRGLLAALLAVTAVVSIIGVRAPAGPRSLRVFDPDRMADLEARMWQAYYRKENLRLFSLSW
jgi:hypothetical protein